MNRAPSKNDNWYSDHQNKCGGNFIKISEPEKKPKIKEKEKNNKNNKNLIKKDPKDKNQLKNKSDNTNKEN